MKRYKLKKTAQMISVRTKANTINSYDLVCILWLIKLYYYTFNFAKMDIFDIPDDYVPEKPLTNE